MDSAFNNSEKHKKWPMTLFLAPTRLRLSVLVLLFVVASLSVVTYFLLERYSGITGADIVFQERNFENTPFSLMDAHDACRYEAQLKLGESLLRSQMLPLSTRFNANNGTYFVVLDADVGVIDAWSGVTIYCDIDPSRQKISYYKEVHSRRESFFGSAINLLSNLAD